MPKKKVVKPQVEVLILLDGSGSMDTLVPATLRGLNSYLDELRSDHATEYQVTLAIFRGLTFSRGGLDFNDLDKIYVQTSLKDVAPIVARQYKCFGQTPLYDAIHAIVGLSAGTPGKTLVVIQTDGEENASIRHGRASIQSLIEEKQKEGWAFVFLGANIDAGRQAQAIGVNQAQTISYQGANTSQVFASVARNTRSYGVTGQATDMGFTLLDRERAGDTYYQQTPAISPTVAVQETVKRGRGRPKGSKNKPKVVAA